MHGPLWHTGNTEWDETLLGLLAILSWLEMQPEKEMHPYGLTAMTDFSFPNQNPKGLVRDRP